MRKLIKPSSSWRSVFYFLLFQHAIAKMTISLHTLCTKANKHFSKSPNRAHTFLSLATIVVTVFSNRTTAAVLLCLPFFALVLICAWIRIVLERKSSCDKIKRPGMHTETLNNWGSAEGRVAADGSHGRRTAHCSSQSSKQELQAVACVRHWNVDKIISSCQGSAGNLFGFMDTLDYLKLHDGPL